MEKKRNTPATVESEVKRLGRSTIIKLANVSTQQVSNVITDGRFPAHWLLPIEAHCAKAGKACPPRHLYRQPVRKPKTQRVRVSQ